VGRVSYALQLTASAAVDALAIEGRPGMVTDDMPELTAAQLAGMQQGTFYRPVKKQITARVAPAAFAVVSAAADRCSFLIQSRRLLM
jgi:hypothetical protein